MNTYLIVSSDKVTLDEKVKELNKRKDADIIYYDLLETPIERLIEDLDTINFLASKKIIIGTNATFLNSDKKSLVEHNLDKFERYIENQSPDNILILVVDSIDKRKKITANLLKNCELIEELSDINSIIKKRLDGYKINSNTITKLIDYCGNDHERIINEIDKLKLYKLAEKEITDSDIEEIVSKRIDDNIFHFIDSILNGNKDKAFEMYHSFILHGDTVVHMIALLSNKIRLMYQVKVLLNDGKNDAGISKLLKIHEYPVKLAREAGYNYSEGLLLEYLTKLSKIDLDIKSGESTGEVEFETLLASI